MRTLFWILLIVNVVLFAVMQRGLGWGEPAYQPQPPLNEKKIRLLDANQTAPKTMPAPAPTAAAAEAPEQMAASGPAASNVPAENPVPPVNSAPPDDSPSHALTASQVSAAKPAPADAIPNAVVCLEWGDFSGADLTRAAGVLSTLQLGDKLGQRQIKYEKGYWVYIPPLKSKTAANKKVSQIRKLGIREYFIVQEGEAMRYAISLGVFKTREAARTYLGELNAKGLRSAKVGERASKLKTTVFMLNSVDDSIEAKLAASARDFPGSELKNVPCALTR
jgi:hypothetical protein